MGGDGLTPTNPRLTVPPGVVQPLPLWFTATAGVDQVVVTVTDTDDLDLRPTVGTAVPLATGRPLAVGASDAALFRLEPAEVGVRALRVEVEYRQGSRLRSFAFQVEVVVGEPTVDGPSTTQPPSSEGGEDPYAYAVFEGAWERLPDFASLQPVLTGRSETIGVEPSLGFDEGVGIRYTTCIRPEVAGTHSFEVRSDDGSWLLLDDYFVAVNDGQHAAQTIAGSVGLDVDQYLLTIDWFDAGADRLLDAHHVDPLGVRRPLDEVVHACEGTVAVLARPVRYEYFEGSFSSPDDLTPGTRVGTGTTFGLDLTQARRPAGYGFRYSACVVSAVGPHTFGLIADDGGRVTVDGQVVAGPGVAPAPVDLEAGSHDVVVEFYQAGGEARLEVTWSGPGFGERRLDVVSC